MSVVHCSIEEGITSVEKRKEVSRVIICKFIATSQSCVDKNAQGASITISTSLIISVGGKNRKEEKRKRIYIRIKMAMQKRMESFFCAQQSKVRWYVFQKKRNRHMKIIGK